MTIHPTQFEIHPSSGVPIYLQIIEQILACLMGKQLKEGDMLPSVRQMAAELGVNPMTISKAYAKLEADGVLERVRGKGMVIRQQPVSGTVQQRQAELFPFIQAAVVRGRQLGLTDPQILSVVEQALKEIPQ